MMKSSSLWVALCILVASSACTNNLDLTPSTTYKGNLTLLTQEEIDKFSHKIYTAIEGNLYIGGDFEGANTFIKNLHGLRKIKQVTGSVIIYNNADLSELHGLHNLEFIGQNIYISDNPVLENINAFTKINDIKGNLTIDNNPSLQHLDGLENVIHIEGQAKIHGNTKLLSLTGLKGLVSVGGSLALEKLPVPHVNELSNLKSVGRHLIIKGLNNLTNLDGLQNLHHVGSGLGIGQNPRLANLCGIRAIAINNNMNNYEVIDNGFNPSIQDLENGICR